MRLGTACAASLLAVVVACGPGSGPGDDTTMNITALTVAPATATLDSVDHAQAFQDFTVRATYEDGSFADVTAMVTWNVQAQFGAMDGARFITTGQVGGVATVTAALDSALGTAEVTINIHTTRIDTSAPANAPELFGNGTLDPSRAPTIVYPSDQVVVPANIGNFDVHWSDASNNDVWEIALKSPHSDIRVYVGATFPRWYAFNAAEWLGAASNADDVVATVRGVATTVPGQIGASTGVTAILPDQPIQGGLYYWAASSSVPDAPYGIFRHDLSLPDQPVEQFYSTVEAGRCVACHILSRDGTKMAVTYDGGNGAAAIVDVATRVATPSPSGAWNFGAYAPQGDVLVTSSGGTLTLRDSSGNPLGAVPTGGFASHPDFSPTGNALAYTLAPAMAAGSADWDVTGGQIMITPYDAVTHALGAAIPLVTVAGNNYYPSISPDGLWVLYNHTDAGSSYNNGNAEIWIVPAAGGTPVRLSTADIGPGLTNSWARWAPFEQTVNGERMFWITVSSKRDFGVRLVGVARPQIWMAGFFPDRAATGVDATAPAFWLPFQDITTNNHIAQWTEQVIPIE